MQPSPKFDEQSSTVEYDLMCDHFQENDVDSSSSLDAIIADDTTSASTARRHIQHGHALIYQGDYHNARQLLTAIKRRTPKKSSLKTNRRPTKTPPIAKLWKQQRQNVYNQTQETKMIMVEVDANHTLVNLRRPPNVQDILSSMYSSRKEPYVLPLRDLLGMIGAHEWYKKGVLIPQLGECIYPTYGVFAPTRNEYLDLVDQAATQFSINDAYSNDEEKIVMMDIGCGTGVLSALMLKKHNEIIDRVIATDTNPSAIQCSQDNISRLGFNSKVQLIQTDLFPADGSKADLIVSNPPWIPGRTDSWLDRAIFDDNDLSFLRRFLLNVKTHLKSKQNSEVWLLLSNLAELLGLRSRNDLMEMIDAGSLQVVDVYHTKPKHPKTSKSRHSYRGEHEEIAAARAAEITSLYRLRVDE